MPLATPTTLNFGTANPQTVKKTNQDNFGSTFLGKPAAGVEIGLKVRHSYEAKKDKTVQMERHNVDITNTVFNADGTTTVVQAYAVIRCQRGAVTTSVQNIAHALADYLTTNKVAISEWDV